MQYDRKITICAAGSRHAVTWPAQEILLSELYDRLRTPARSTETMAEYLALRKAQQDDLKDVGGFVAGLLRGGRRTGDAVASRDVLTLDLDSLSPGSTEDVVRRVASLGCGYCVYSTRKHRPDAPRLRVLLPLDRPVTADEYEPIARMAASYIDPEMRPFDPTTFQPVRLMYWPSCCADGAYVYQWGDNPLLCADGVLGQYTDWHDYKTWPQVPGAAERAKKLAARAEDPLSKGGVIGAWCRIHSIGDVLDNVLSGVYTPTDTPDRWTYAAGSTTGGALVYDDKFLYSHHATDPAGGRLCNAFDLCRIHLFGAQDEDAKPETPIGKLPSYKAMCTYARHDARVEDALNEERYEQAVEDFTTLGGTDAAGGKPAAREWMRELTVKDSGSYECSIHNAATMIEGDPRMHGRIRLNAFSGRIEGTCPLPWAGRREGDEVFEWANSDDAGLRNIVEGLLKFHSTDVINDGLVLTATEHKYNPVQAYLQGLIWDGVARLDRLYQDYFGEADTAYVRAVGRKSLVAAVARAMEPGVKYDQMVVICGPQGTYKSTFVARLGGAWAASLMVSFDDPKAVAEVIQGRWVVEVPELSSLSKADTNVVKQMLSQNVDEYRAAYDRRAEKHPRQCVFFGTTNDTDYLKDPTGNRRFWPIDCGASPPKNVWDDLTPAEVDQLWAEAYARWQMGEGLVLGPEEEQEAEARRSGHTERDDYEGQIAEFLERPVPVNWMQMDASERDIWLNGQTRGDIEVVHRDRICVLEILRECLGISPRGVVRRADSNRISKIMDKIPGWEKAGTRKFGAGYGNQKAWWWVGRER